MSKEKVDISYLNPINIHNKMSHHINTIDIDEKTIIKGDETIRLESINIHRFKN